MPKTYKKTPFTRRLRRMLEREGIDAKVEWREHLCPANIISNPCIHIETFREDEVWKLDQSVVERPTDNDLQRLFEAAMREWPGIPERMIEQRIETLGPLVTIDQARETTVTGTAGSEACMMNVPATVHDMLGRSYDIVLHHPYGVMEPHHQSAFEWTKGVEYAVRRNIDAKGRPRSVTLNGTTVCLLRELPDGERLLEELPGAMERAIDQIARKSSHLDPYTVDKAEFEHHGIPFMIRKGRIGVKRYEFKGVTIDNDNIVVDSHLPETMLSAIVGRPVKDVIEGMPLAKDLPIAKAKNRKAPWKGVAIKVTQKPMTIEALSKEFTKME